MQSPKCRFISICWVSFLLTPRSNKKTKEDIRRLGFTPVSSLDRTSFIRKKYFIMHVFLNVISRIHRHAPNML